MTDQQPESGSQERRSAETPGMPRWVKVFAVVAVIFVVLLLVMLLTGHGPGRHLHGGLGGLGGVQPWS